MLRTLTLWPAFLLNTLFWGALSLAGSLFDPSGSPIEGQEPHRLVGKIGIDATAKARHNIKDFERAWPINWGKVRLEDYL